MAHGYHNALCATPLTLRTRGRGTVLIPERGTPVECATHLEHNAPMNKNAILPQVRVPPELRRDAEASLAAGESLSQLVEAAVRTEIRARALRADFLFQGMEAVLEYDRDGKAVDADEFVGRLERKLDAALSARRRTAT